MGVLLALLTAFLFALGNIYNRKASKKHAALHAMALSIALNAVIFMPLALLIKLVQGTPWPEWKAVFFYAIAGVVGTFLGRWGMFATIALIGPSRASVIKNSAPAFAVVLAYIFLDQLPGILSFLGIVSILIGIWLIGGEEGNSKQIQGSHWTKGIMLGLLVAFIFASADILRSISMNISPDAIMALGISSLAGWLAMSLYLAFKGQFLLTYKQHIKSIDRDILFGSLYTGIGSFTNFLAVYYLYVAYVSALVATAPLLTAVLSYLMTPKDEKFGIKFWICAILMICGSALISLFG